MEIRGAGTLPPEPLSVDAQSMAATPTLLTLELRSLILFPEPLEATDAPLALAATECGEAGAELLFTLPDELFIEGDEGPRRRGRFVAPMPVRARREASGPAGGEGDRGGIGLAEGLWFFMQWRPGDEEELLNGIEWFARELWWERRATEGPRFLRVVREDGKLAWQLLQRAAEERSRPRH